MSDEDPKPVKEQPVVSGVQDPSTEAEEGDSTENGTPSVEDESTTLGEEGLSTENGNASIEDESTPVGDEFSSFEDGSTPTIVETPTSGEERPTDEEERSTVEEERPTVEEERPTVEEERPTVEEDRPTVEEERPSVEEERATGDKSPTAEGELPTTEEEERATADKSPTAEGELPTIEEERPSVEEERATAHKSPTAEGELPTIEEERPSMEEERTTADKECSPKEEHTPAEEVEEQLTYVEPKYIVLEHNTKKRPSVVQDHEFFDRSIQTTLTSDPIDREIQTTLRYERSFSTSSLNAFMGDDSASSLKECPSIEEEPAPEPIVGEILKVRAQVMVRNDSTGGWVPEGCGGMSTVTIYKIETPVKPGEERMLTFLVKGKRLSDQKDTLACTVFEDLEYNKVMPTFHHWKTGNKRFGLTFQTTFEARTFDKILRKSVHERQLLRDPNAVPLKVEGDDDDDFLAFTKPAEPRPRTPSPEISYALPDYLLPYAEEEEKIQFMQLTSLPEYYYQDLRKDDHSAEEKLKRRPYRHTKKPLKFFGMIRRSTRLRCKFCHELYEEDENKRGKCHYAPNRARSFINSVSCMRCTKWLMRDCMMDPDEDFSHPCSCGDDGYCGIRWLGLCFLSFFLPCILLYPPMKGCYYCGVRCGACGERHQEKVVRRFHHII